MKVSNESKVGILAAVGIAVLFIGFNYLKGINVFHKGTDYFVEYTSSGGLNVGDPVIIDGFTVGRVKNVELQEDQSGVDVILNFSEDVKIPEGSNAVIRGNLMGEKYIQIFLSSNTAIVPPGGNLVGQIEADLANTISAEFKPITDKVKTMLSSMDTAINVLRGIFTDDVQKDFQKSMLSIKQTLESFNKSAEKVNLFIAKEEENIDNIITDVSGITDYMNQSENDVKAILANLKSVTDSLNSVEWQELGEQFSLAADNINKISTKINDSAGSLGLLVNDQQLYYDLSNTLVTLDSVINEFGKNPEIRLKLFGK
ncbi:MAG: MCE family protein [Chitinophagales bacterium]|nr:MCE family protein [Chitinophagales bacterium]MBP9796527.1 MCE family protein [Chitinophagales bacterium]